jgi:hypothetical protein
VSGGRREGGRTILREARKGCLSAARAEIRSLREEEEAVRGRRRGVEIKADRLWVLLEKRSYQTLRIRRELSPDCRTHF